MYRLKFIGKLIVLAVIAILFFACSMVGMGNAVADAEEEVQTEETEKDEESLVSGFLGQLKDKYGEDYEVYYNAILNEWGSVEAYLLSLADGENIPDVAADGWKQFIGWLGEYSPIWGSILAVVCLIIVILFGKVALKKVKQAVVAIADKFKTLFKSVNKQYGIMKAQNDALLALLGENPKYEEKRKALIEANGEIEKDDV